MQYRELFFCRTKSFYLYVAQQQGYQGGYPVVSETFVKVKAGSGDGVRHIVQRHPSFLKSDSTKIVNDCLRKGHFSPRPYRAGQLCDRRPVMAALTLVCWLY